MPHSVIVAPFSELTLPVQTIVVVLGQVKLLPVDTVGALAAVVLSVI